MKKPSIFSFFAGAGFLDLGFEDEDFEIVYVNEVYKPFLRGYKHSRKILNRPTPRHGFDESDIKKIHSQKLFESITAERNLGNLVGFIGGPPCPDFSVGGKNRGKEGDNGHLSKVYIDLICKHRPDFFLFENVKGLYRTKKHRDFFEEIKLKLKMQNYVLEERLINSIEYGAPQDRDRIILLGFRRGVDTPQKLEWLDIKYPERKAFSMDWPETDVFGVGVDRVKPNKVLQELTVQYWFDKNQVEHHKNYVHCFKPRAGLARFLTVSEGDDSKKSYKRLHRWRYSPTAAYGNNEVHLHPYQARRINVAEALAIQSLPKKFELPEDMTLTDMFKTIGNGVPYLAARGLAKTIRVHLEGSNEGYSTESRERDQPIAERQRVSVC